MRTAYNYIAIVMLLLSAACSDTDVEPTGDVVGFTYLPLTQFPDTLRYQVEEINYRNDGTVDTANYTLLDVITTRDSAETVEVEGFRIENRGSQSEVRSSLEFHRTPQLGRQRLGNTEETILSFPIEEQKIWEGRTFINEVGEDEIDEYQYENTYQPFQLGDSTFQQCIQITQENNQDSTIFYDQRFEIYAPDVGMIYRLSSQLTFCNETECLGQQIIEFGQTRRIRRIFE